MNKLMSARNKKTKLAKKDAVTGFIFSLPSVSGMLVFFLIPFIICIVLSLTDNINSMNFVGIDNYVDIISSQTFRLAAWNTLKFILVSVPLIMVFSFLIASLLYQKLKGFEFFRSVFVFPLVLPVSSVILFFQMIFAEKGLANDVLSLMGLPVKDWLNSSASFISWSVFLPCAETTTTTLLSSSYNFITLFATNCNLLLSATELPPNLITIVSIFCTFLNII